MPALRVRRDFARLEQAVSARVRANSLGDASSEASSETARSHSAPPPTLLCATLGAFSVLDDQNDLDFVVLENAFYGADAEGNASWRAYDLKGSLRGRYAATRDAEANAANDQRDAERAAPRANFAEAVVLMDGNVAETCATDPIAIGRESFQTLERAIRADVAFLESQNVMDYSLLVGIDGSPERREVVVRVIDYLRQYTWDKQIESAVKSGVPSYGGAPTVLSPAKYARRFRRRATVLPCRRRTKRRYGRVGDGKNCKNSSTKNSSLFVSAEVAHERRESTDAVSASNAAARG